MAKWLQCPCVSADTGVLQLGAASPPKAWDSPAAIILYILKCNFPAVSALAMSRLRFFQEDDKVWSGRSTKQKRSRESCGDRWGTRDVLPPTPCPEPALPGHCRAQTCPKPPGSSVEPSPRVAEKPGGAETPRGAETPGGARHETPRDAQHGHSDTGAVPIARSHTPQPHTSPPTG